MSYIERESVLKLLESKKLIFEESTPVDEAIAEQMSVVVEAIEEASTADVVEIRHGEWKTIPDYSHALTTYLHICSECKTTYKDVRPKGHNYCHICGAKMDGERSEE